MQFFRQNRGYLIAGVVYLLVASYLTWEKLEFYTLFPIGLLAIYAVIFHTKLAFVSLAFLTPLSINIEEYTDSFGLFIPTEPILFALLLLIIMLQLRKPIIDKAVWKNEIVWVLGAYLVWLVISGITSSNPVVSFKFLLARVWFMVPMIIYGSTFFQDMKSIRQFIWLLIVGMSIVICYTLIVHASYQFGEDEGHWVMTPFFKDHTIYGAIVAFVVPLVIGLYFSKKHTPLIQAVILLLIVIVLLGLYFSYTRAAWLSIIAAIGVWLLIKLRIKFSFVIGTALILGIGLLFSWDTIKMELERNKSEHTTEQFGERLQSATNVSSDASNLERINRWSCAIEMFKERPVFGFGPGTYAFEYARFQSPENLTIISTNFGNLGNAHSEYLGALSEMGLVGFLIMLAIVAVIFWKGITLYIRWPQEDKEIRTLLLSMILALVTYFVHGVLNNFLDTDKAAVPVWGVCAVFIALEISLQNSYKKTQTDS